MTYDFYPHMADGTELPGYFEDLAVFQETGRRHGFDWGICIQTTDYWPVGHPDGGRRRPNANEVMWQANQALAHGAKSIIHFTYWTPTIEGGIEDFGAAIIGRDGSKTDLYEAARQVNAWFASAADATEGLVAEGPNLVPAGERRESGSNRLTVTRGDAYLTTYLGLDRATGAIGIFNSSHAKPAVVSIDAVAGAHLITSSNTEQVSLPVAELSLPPGAGAMVSIPK
jgi:hypothetical protein